MNDFNFQLLPVNTQRYTIRFASMPAGKAISGQLSCKQCAWGVLLAADTVAQAEADLLFAQREHHVTVHAG